MTPDHNGGGQPFLERGRMMRPIALFGTCLLLAISMLCVGCLRPKLAGRRLFGHESTWAQTITRSYPGWRAPYLAPMLRGGEDSSWSLRAYDSRAAVIAPTEAIPVQGPGNEVGEDDIELIPVDGTIPPPVRSGKTYTVKKGDSLRGIAAKVLGDERHWESLLKQNQSKLSNPDQLRPGMILELPFL